MIDSTIGRAQTYSERMTGMKNNQHTDAGLMITTQPHNFNGQLRDYQLEGFRWIVRRAFAGESIILADEMGLGASSPPRARVAPRCGPTLTRATHTRRHPTSQARPSR